jgi:hypothetical protein
MFCFTNCGEHFPYFAMAVTMMLASQDSGIVKTAATCGTAPTLRTEREEWGTHFSGCACGIKGPRPPPIPIGQ